MIFKPVDQHRSTSTVGIAMHSSGATEVQSLYSEHCDWLRGLLYRRIGCTERAADLAQDVFLRLLSRDAPPALNQPRAYLARIAHGLLVDDRRRRNLEEAWRQIVANRPQEDMPSAESQAVILEALARIDRLIEGLSPRARQVLLYSRLEGWSHARIASELGVSLSTVEKDMATALRHCHDVLMN